MSTLDPCPRCGGGHYGSMDCPYLGAAICMECHKPIVPEAGNDHHNHLGRWFDARGRVSHAACHVGELPAEDTGSRPAPTCAHKWETEAADPDGDVNWCVRCGALWHGDGSITLPVGGPQAHAPR